MLSPAPKDATFQTGIPIKKNGGRGLRYINSGSGMTLQVAHGSIFGTAVPNSVSSGRGFGNSVGFVLTAVVIKNSALWDITRRSPLKINGLIMIRAS
jgi:hypothetical protein